MAEYIHLFETTSEFSGNYNGSAYAEPWVSYTLENTHVDYNKSEKEKLLGMPLTFEFMAGGNFAWSETLGSQNEVSYRFNDGPWISAGSGFSLTVASGDTIQIKGTAVSATYDTESPITCNCSNWKVKGNIMSVLYGDGYQTADSFKHEVSFDIPITCGGFFSGCTGLIDASQLKLPVTTLEMGGMKPGSYQNMFAGCTSLTAGPELPATVLSDLCYTSMFEGCTSLTTVPELPATTLTGNCYSRMFLGCTSLSTAPELPATAVTEYCYAEMFEGCTGLTAAPELPATTMANYCYGSMFSGCTSLTTAPELPARDLAEACYHNMFAGCTSLTAAPELGAEILDNFGYCYAGMFCGCTSLNYVKAMFITNPNEYGDYPYTFEWLKNVSATGTFVKNSIASWTTEYNENVIPTGWTVVNA